MTAALTRDFGKFVADLRFEQIPAAAMAIINTAFADSIGVMVAGARESAPRLLQAMLVPAGNEATLMGGDGRERASALDAAWINGTAAHALDLDDVAQRGGHPSAVLVPAIVAEAEALGASGAQMVLAYAAGYETFADLARRDADHDHDKGWHPTGIFGPIAAAAACASLRGLDARGAAMAIALGASQSAGLTSNFGTMTKPFHAGRAAHAGVAAARLVERGFTAGLDALEQSPGFLMAVSLAGNIDTATPVRAGVEWQMCGSNRLGIKKYPHCYCTHRALDGMLDLRAAHALLPDDIKQVTVSLSHRCQSILRNHRPQTGLEATFSIEFAMASALIAGRAGIAEVNDAFVRRPDVQSLMQRVSVTPDASDDPQHPRYAVHDRVWVETHDGRTFDSGPIRYVRGDPNLPLSRDDLWTKFAGCMEVGRPRAPAHQLFDRLASLDQVAHVAEIMRLLAT